MLETYLYSSESEQDTTTKDLCASCIGACCLENTVLELSPEEAFYLSEVGTDLLPLTKSQFKRMSGGAVRTRRGKTQYVLQSDCGNLDPETKQCTDYDDRPQVCRELKAGSYVCGEIRDSRIPQEPVNLPMPTIRPNLPEAV
jgi:Fe-S-cluster containining protein